MLSVGADTCVPFLIMFWCVENSTGEGVIK